MPKDNAHGQSLFNAAQLMLAGTRFEEALAALERITIGAHYNQRQRDLLVILAEQYDAEMAGKEVNYMVKEKFEISIGGHLGRSPGTIKNDLKAMGDLVHTPFINGGTRDKAYKLTDKGHALYHAYKISKAQLILDAADAIRSESDRRKPAGAGTLISVLGAAYLAIGAASQVEASDIWLDVGYTYAEVKPDHVDSYAMQLADMPSLSALPASPCDMKAEDIMAAAIVCDLMIQMGKVESINETWAIFADRQSMFDEHLPKLFHDIESYATFDLASY